MIALLIVAAAPHHAVAKPNPYARQFAEARAAVLGSLKDPLSAKIQQLYPFTDADGIKKICGQVLAKNSYGAYTGFQHFAYLLDRQTVIFAPDADDTSDDANEINRAGSGCVFGIWHH